ncbi:MAG TPA: SRPBCC domain-containing protein [Polyangiaceae bacterium LLY-WYZ-14_1]|nr:SRPBCC domain-containing protein [Polyangiaceae bacterium LLY-WYZ-14_1]
MTEEKNDQSPESRPHRGFLVEVTVHAPKSAVWKALRDRETLSQWFGWDYANLGAELEFMFFQYAAEDSDAGVLRMEPKTTVTVEEASGAGVTVVRVVQAGPIGDTDWEDVYDGEREGWRQFLTQLRHRLEVEPAGRRRTLRLGGQAAPAELLPALQAWLPGEAFDETPFQRTWRPAGTDIDLVNVEAWAPVTRTEAATAHLTLTTHGLDDERFDALVRTAETTWKAHTAPPHSVER